MADFDELAEKAERGQWSVVPGTVRHGPAPAEAGRKAMLEPTGAADLAEATRIALGRPRLDTQHGPSPVWRGRATENLVQSPVSLVGAGCRSPWSSVKPSKDMCEPTADQRR
jgi:hypothetical protein